MAAVGGAGGGDPPALISIPSQHMGNCASDTIQIVLFFADGYKDYFREIAAFIAPRERRPFLDLFKHKDFLIYDYIYTAARRYLHLGSVEPATLVRRPSEKLNEYESMNSGVRCSTLIAGILEKKLTKKNETGKNILNITSWGYTKQDYDAFMTKLFDAAKKLKTAFDIRSCPHICFSYTFDPAGLQAVQFFTVPKSYNSFHTFCLIRHNRKFYIGDNMLGFLIPANHIDKLTTHYIGVDDEISDDGVQYTRTFFWYNPRNPAERFEIAKITRPMIKYIGIYNERYLEIDMSKPWRVYYNYNIDCTTASSTTRNNIRQLAAAAAAAREAGGGAGAGAGAAAAALGPAVPAAGGNGGAGGAGGAGAAAAALGPAAPAAGKPRRNNRKTRRFRKYKM